MFKETYRKFGLAPTNLSRTAEDAGTVVEPILPWTAAGVYMATMLGVPTLEYLPYAFLNYTGMIFALIWAATGIGITKLSNFKYAQVGTQVAAGESNASEVKRI